MDFTTVIRLDEVGIVVEDLDASIAFFQGLGLELSRFDAPAIEREEIVGPGLGRRDGDRGGADLPRAAAEHRRGEADEPRCAAGPDRSVPPGSRCAHDSRRRRCRVFGREGTVKVVIPRNSGPFGWSRRRIEPVVKALPPDVVSKIVRRVLVAEPWGFEPFEYDAGAGTAYFASPGDAHDQAVRDAALRQLLRGFARVHAGAEFRIRLSGRQRGTFSDLVEQWFPACAKAIAGSEVQVADPSERLFRRRCARFPPVPGRSS